VFVSDRAINVILFVARYMYLANLERIRICVSFISSDLMMLASLGFIMLVS
jgi:hypothetical protein